MPTLTARIHPPVDGRTLAANWLYRRGHEIAPRASLKTDGSRLEATFDAVWGLPSLRNAVEIEVGRCSPGSSVLWH